MDMARQNSIRTRLQAIKIKFMKALLFILLSISLLGCSSQNGRKENSQNSNSNNKKDESFEEFFNRFYQDSIFQETRVIRPLMGGILTEGNIEKWGYKKFRIYSKEEVLKEIPELKSEIQKNDSIRIERLWVDNSGFNVEREFVNRNGKWLLKRIDITNI